MAVALIIVAVVAAVAGARVNRSDRTWADHRAVRTEERRLRSLRWTHLFVAVWWVLGAALVLAVLGKAVG